MYRFSWATAALLALALFAAAPAAARTTTHTLSVVGNGKVFVTPNVADLSVSVTRNASSSAQALSAANQASKAVVHAVEALGIPAKDIQTQNVSVNSFKHKHQTRWSANESLGIQITNVKLVGPVIDSATHAGASSVSGPTFSFSNPSAGIKAATRAAIADAQARAKNAAAVIGYKVTGVKSIDLDPQGVVPIPTTPSGAGKTGSGTPTSIYPGSQEVDAQVAIVFTIRRA